MRVLYATAEFYPWVKSGGLGDVAAALPQALLALGLDTRLLLPGFAGFLDAFSGVTDVARLRTPFAPERVRVGLARLPGSERLAYLVDHPAFYDRPGTPIRVRTETIGPTTIAASGSSAGSQRNSRAVPTRTGPRIFSTVTTGTPRLRRLILRPSHRWGGTS